MYVRMYVCMHVRACACMYVRMHEICVDIWSVLHMTRFSFTHYIVFVKFDINLGVHVCMTCVSLYVCMCVYMYVCMCVCEREYLCMYVCCTYVRLFIRMYVCI